MVVKKKNVQVVAHAILNNLDENGRPEYILSLEPSLNSHECKPTPVPLLQPQVDYVVLKKRNLKEIFLNNSFIFGIKPT